MNKKKLKLGELIILEDVFKLFVKMATKEIEGVECASKSFGKMLGKLQPSMIFDEISITEIDQEVIKIEMEIAIHYGYKAPEVMPRLQQIIKQHVELYTGFQVKEINISIVDVILQNE